MKTVLYPLVLFLFVCLLAGGSLPAQAEASEAYNCNAQSAIPPAECEVLVTLYNSTNGASWTDHTGWLISSDPCGWYGIDCIGNNVTHVILYNNNLSGSIPPTLGSLSALMTLSLSNNNISGSIPAELGSLSTLINLLLGSNQLTGGIPSSLGDLSLLTNLYLNNNQLTRGIPLTLGNLNELETLDLSNNQLTGSIPAALGNLSALKSLDLSNNQLTGAIPTNLGDLSDLIVLVLANNQLLGLIPQTLTGLTQLVNFNFSGNSLCEPDNTAYQAWKMGVLDYIGTDLICQQELFYSQSTYDGWVRESSENSNKGGAINSDWLVCYVGDDPYNRQYRTILHFNTSRLLNDAVVAQATLQYKQHSIVGDDPYATHGNLVADIKEGFFSNNAALVLSDFGAASSMNNAGVFSFIPTSLAYPLYRTTLRWQALQYINLDGVTQFRLRFAIDDDNDSTADYIKTFCGDMDVPFNRPMLRVWYYLP